MKKLFFVMLFCIVLALVTSCGNELETPIDTSDDIANEAPTEAPYDAPGKGTAEDATEVPTEPATDASTEDTVGDVADTPVTVWGDNSDVREDLAHYTVELTETVYTTNDKGVRFRFRAKEPGYTGFSDNWKLYKFVDGEKIYVGSNPMETAFELSPKTEGGYVDCEMSFSFRYIYTWEQLDTLEVGRYCLEMHRGSDENGVPIVVARLSFEVIPAE